MRVLVTGAAGNLGRVLLPALAAAGHQARAFDQRPVDGAHEVLTGDVRNLDDVRRAMDGVDAVMHGAATLERRRVLGHQRHRDSPAPTSPWLSGGSRSPECWPWHPLPD